MNERNTAKETQKEDYAETDTTPTYVPAPHTQIPITKTYTLREHLDSSKNYKIDYKAELNEKQYEAVITTSGPVLCIAGAGSGKTRTLIYRVSRLIESGVPPEKILLLTFTKKAAQEMMRRAAHILDDRCKRIKGGTFHGFANYLLRRFHVDAGLGQNFTIIDRSDAEDLINLIRTEKDLGKNDTRFPKKNTILDIFSKSVNTTKSFSEIIQSDYPQFLEHAQALEQLQIDYQKNKRARNVLDYDDLLVELKLLLSCNPQICKRLSQEFLYIMIDEYQDTNIIQSDIGFLLASEHNNLLAVGDDAQSIYSFRGAHFKNIIHFPKKFPECKIIALEENYRSNQSILNFANGILDSASEKYPKKLYSSKNADHKPVLLKPLSVHEQAEFIAQRVLELSEEGVPLTEIAVLFRAAWHSNELEVALTARNIPFVKYGGLKFTEAAHVKDLLAFARVITNYKDTISWLRILLLIEGVGPKSARDIANGIYNGTETLDALLSYEKKKYGKELVTLREQLLPLRSPNLSPREKFEVLAKIYLPFLKVTYDDYVRRIDDIHSLSAIAERYETIEAFLDDLSLEIPDLTQEGAEASPKEEEFLTLSTVHSSKGLEWHTVFVISLIDGYLPSSRSLDKIEDIEEERRLFYVACTRAKENLFLLCPEHSNIKPYGGLYSGLSFSEPSRFINDIKDIENLIEVWQLKNEY